jgi:hypothetical protein
MRLYYTGQPQPWYDFTTRLEFVLLPADGCGLLVADRPGRPGVRYTDWGRVGHGRWLVWYPGENAPWYVDDDGLLSYLLASGDMTWDDTLRSRTVQSLLNAGVKKAHRSRTARRREWLDNAVTGFQFT